MQKLVHFFLFEGYYFDHRHFFSKSCSTVKRYKSKLILSVLIKLILGMNDFYLSQNTGIIDDKKFNVVVWFRCRQNNKFYTFWVRLNKQTFKHSKILIVWNLFYLHADNYGMSLIFLSANRTFNIFSSYP